MRKTGVWLDKKKALIVDLENGSEKLTTIDSNVETFHVHGGSGTRLKGGPQDVVQDSKYLEREKHQLRNYFNDIIESINDTDALAIFGPAEAFMKFEKELEDNHKDLSKKVKTVTRADSMTDNQVKALVREFYNSEG